MVNKIQDLYYADTHGFEAVLKFLPQKSLPHGALSCIKSGPSKSILNFQSWIWVCLKTRCRNIWSLIVMFPLKLHVWGIRRFRTKPVIYVYIVISCVWLHIPWHPGYGLYLYTPLSHEKYWKIPCLHSHAKLPLDHHFKFFTWRGMIIPAYPWQKSTFGFCGAHYPWLNLWLWHVKKPSGND